ncbi:alpha/beta hydrolase [Pseudonocardia humida]|uniref:Alpha/beta hydrolase n=1 Tax=Pseudonocardia humida TaxID=2800819 RepID=A0ABT1AAM7_9PSEU|nr:alpha/beta hydrolase [Pseudonocardia humida]MCO1659988.1 alpha/beta hydrolase [Pseudonocardia humida]
MAASARGEPMAAGGQVRFHRGRRFWRLVVPVVSATGVLAAFRLSPWPGALVIRAVFEANNARVTAAMAGHAPATDVQRITDQQYRVGDEDALLDVYFPAAAPAGARLPVIVWTHGGAWLSGSKDDAAPYFELLAAQGFTVVAPNYTLAPRKPYPAQLHQLNRAHAYVVENAERFHADTGTVFLAGDSAGAQLSSQLAALITNPAHAAEVGIVPSLSPAQLCGVVLNCGIYRMERLTHPSPTLPRLVGWGNDVATWAYAGTRDFSDPVIRQMSPYHHVTADFPPTFISGGNGDPLTEAQSEPFADKLRSLGVRTTSLFHPVDHEPALPHEYQFDLGTEEGRVALATTVEFLRDQLAEAG